MSDFYALRNNMLKRDTNLIRRLEMKQRLGEPVQESRKFRAHPKRILSDSDATLSNTPRLLFSYSPSTSSLNFQQAEIASRKLKAQHIQKSLHEKLSILDRNSTTKNYDFRSSGDNRPISPPKDVAERYRTRPIDPFCSSSSSGSSTDLQQTSEDSSCKSMEKNPVVKSRHDNNYSAASKATSGGDRVSAGSKMSSQSVGARGIPISVFDRKFKVLVEKSLRNISEIRSILTKGLTLPDGEEDESRRLIRNKEFSNRFSRNYLYPLARQLKELPQAQSLNPLLFNQKLLSTYQIASYGLQAYQNHLPIASGDCTFNQLKILMNNIVDLCGIHRERITDQEGNYVLEFIDTFKINAELAIQKVDEFYAKPSAPDGLKSEPSKISLTKHGEGRKKSNQKVGGNKPVDKRFSMYAVTASFRRDTAWKKTMENLAKKKFNVKSKYKTATYKHRPPVEKEPDECSGPKLRTLFRKKSGSPVRATRFNSPIREDSIKTMVEIEGHGGNHEVKETKKEERADDEASNKEEILIKLLQFALKNHTQDENQSHIADITELVKHEPNVEFLNKVLDRLNITKPADDSNKENHENQQLTLEIVQSQHSLSDGGATTREKSKRKEPKITISGEKNARLICITDENSIIEPPQEDKIPENNLSQPDAKQPVHVITRTSSETQTDTQKEKNMKPSIKGTQKGKNTPFVKLSRMKKCGRNLKHLEKQQAVDAIQYKLDFYRHCKNNPMYKRSTNCQPWMLMGKISEELLNQCILAVAREIEVNDIVEKVYQSELQL